MKPFATQLSILGLVGVLLVSQVYAGTEATVTATVTVQNISVAVADGTITYGTLGQNATAGTVALTDTQVATNDGNITEDFNVKGQNSANWTLAATAGSDQYIHRFCNSSCGSPPTNYTALTTSYATLASGIATTATTSLDLFINTPNPSTVFTQQSVDVMVQAVAN